MPRGKHANHRRGPSHHRWNRQRIISSHGYVRVRVGADHPLADPNGYAYEHLVVWAQAGNPPLATNEVLHHINHDKADNRVENLRLMNRGIHTITEHLGRDDLGRFAPKDLSDGRTWEEVPE